MCASVSFTLLPLSVCFSPPLSQSFRLAFFLSCLSSSLSVSMNSSVSRIEESVSQSVGRSVLFHHPLSSSSSSHTPPAPLTFPLLLSHSPVLPLIDSCSLSILLVRCPFICPVVSLCESQYVPLCGPFLQCITVCEITHLCCLHNNKQSRVQESRVQYRRVE